MIEVKAVSGEKDAVEVICSVDGDLEALAVETIAVINGVYNAIAADSGPAELALFQAVVMDAVADYSSSVWEKQAVVEEGQS